jgi:Tfp pilus assembly protein PilV
VTKSTTARGFSLVEIAIALGIVSFALIAILGLIPVSMNSARDAVDQTRTSMIAQDVYNRMRASMTSNDSNSQFYFAAYAAGVASFFFYTPEGDRNGELLHVPAPGDAPQFYGNISRPTDFYRAKVTVGVVDQNTVPNTWDPRHVPAGTTPELLAATVEVRWPVNTQDGTIVSATAPGRAASYSFLLRKP